MPLIPSFSAYPAQPNLAEAYLGGQRIAVSREQIAQQAAEAAQRASIAREQIAANQVENQMRLQAQQQQLQQKMLQEQHQAEVANAYKQIQLGLEQRRVTADEEITAMRLGEAARGFTAQQAFERARARRKAAGESDLEASQGAFLETGTPGQPGFAGVISPPSQIPQVSLQLRQLEARRKTILDQYPGDLRATITPEHQAELAEIGTAIKGLQIPGQVNAPSGTAATASPAAIPPRPSSVYMGPQSGVPAPVTPPNIYMGPQPAPIPNAAPQVGLTNTSPGLTIPSGITPAAPRRRVWNPKTSKLE